jgi:hypothetical protein
MAMVISLAAVYVVPAGRLMVPTSARTVLVAVSCVAVTVW